MRMWRFWLVLAFSLAWPAAAHADPVSATLAVVGAVKTFAATAVGSFLLNTTASTALSWAAGKLTKRKATVSERQASVTSLSMGEVPRELVVGEACTGGSLIDVFNHGGQYGTATVTRVIALADHLLDGLVGYYVNDEYHAWTNEGFQPGFNQKLSIYFHNATKDGHAPRSHLFSGGWRPQDRL